MSRLWTSAPTATRAYPTPRRSTARSLRKNMPPFVMDDILDRARSSVTQRAELPGMSLLEHLEELRRRLIHSVVYIIVAFCVAYFFHEKIYNLMQAPITFALKKHGLPPQLVIHNPVDGFNMYLKISFMGGCIFAAPFVLYQV